MRSVPSRWMVGSTRPISLTRRSMIWIDGLTDPLGDRRIGRGERDRAAVLADVDVALSRGAGEAGYRLRQLAQLGHRGIDVGIAGDVHLHGIAVNGAAGKRNARLPQHAQHVIVDGLQLLLTHRAGVDLK